MSAAGPKSEVVGAVTLSPQGELLPALQRLAALLYATRGPGVTLVIAVSRWPQLPDPEEPHALRVAAEEEPRPA